MADRCEHCNTLKDLAVSWSHELNAKDEDAVTAELIARGLMEGDPPVLKMGYSLNNAAIASAEYVYGRSFSFNNPQLTALIETLSREPDEATKTAVYHLRHETCAHTVDRV